MGEIKTFYSEASACVRGDVELKEGFPIEVRVRQGCVMSPWLGNILMDVCIREMTAKVGTVGARLKINRMGWAVVACR